MKTFCIKGKELYFKIWIQAGFKKVRDVLYEVKEGFLPIQAIIDEVEETKEEFNVKSLKQQYGQMKEKERLNKIERNEEKNGNKMQVLMRGNNHMENFML